MFYCDASLIVSVLTIEVHTESVDRWLRAQPGRSLAIRAWLDVEVASALAMKLRRGVISGIDRQRALARWASVAGGCAMLPIEPATYMAAARHVDSGPRGLRAGDALHLAIAERQGCGTATLDGDLAAAEGALGMVVASLRKS